MLAPGRLQATRRVRRLAIESTLELGRLMTGD